MCAEIWYFGLVMILYSARGVYLQVLDIYRHLTTYAT